ncbi:four helix bundle protein [Candidatus Uabimicrobium sp. HlEnr_7]|uniref:four helix bundle protein n=1 Tax=Candidatus Uabimicrobium helgolandensis TaxID=3095367 RepID=UPI003559009D
MQLNYEKLDVIKLLLSLSFQILKNMPNSYGFPSDQLKRASLSIPLNITEGNGKFSEKDKAKFYHIARGSATEYTAIFDAAKIMEIIDSKQWQNGKTLLVRIVSMLCKMLLRLRLRIRSRSRSRSRISN